MSGTWSFWHSFAAHHDADAATVDTPCVFVWAHGAKGKQYLFPSRFSSSSFTQALRKQEPWMYKWKSWNSGTSLDNLLLHLVFLMKQIFFFSCFHWRVSALQNGSLGNCCGNKKCKLTWFSQFAIFLPLFLSISSVIFRVWTSLCVCMGSRCSCAHEDSLVFGFVLVVKCSCPHYVREYSEV